MGYEKEKLKEDPTRDRIRWADIAKGICMLALIGGKVPNCQFLAATFVIKVIYVTIGVIVFNGGKKWILRIINR